MHVVSGLRIYYLIKRGETQRSDIGMMIIITARGVGVVRPSRGG